MFAELRSHGKTRGRRTIKYVSEQLMGKRQRVGGRKMERSRKLRGKFVRSWRSQVGTRSGGVSKVMREDTYIQLTGRGTCEEASGGS
jgi:hypothetical protein